MKTVLRGEGDVWRRGGRRAKLDCGAGLRRVFLEISSYLPVEISRGTVKWPSGGAEFYGGE